MAPSFIARKCSRVITPEQPVTVTNRSPSRAACAIGITQCQITVTNGTTTTKWVPAPDITVSFTKMADPAITANKPVLLKTSVAPASVTFTGVTIKNAEPKVAGNYFDFVGSYEAQKYVETGNYYLSANKLYRSSKDNGTYIKGMRAYLKAKVANARVANFGIEEETTEVDATLNDKGKMIHEKWYTLDGRKLDKQPTKKGMYINNGKRVVIK